MSYDHKLLLNAVAVSLRRSPLPSLRDLAGELRVSQRTIQKALFLAYGKTFRRLRDEILVEQVSACLRCNPAIAIKEVSFCVGFKSASSFGRAIKRACGCSPEELRSSIVRDLLTEENLGHPSENRSTYTA